MNAPRLWLTSMSGPGDLENIREMIDPVREWLDGVIWVLHDCAKSDSGAQYLESVKGGGRVIYRPWPRGRHFHSMNDLLWCGPQEEGDYCLFADPLERPAAPFVRRIKSEIGPMMAEADVGMIAYYGKPYLFRYTELLEFRLSPHWTLTGWTGRGMDWNQIEPDESRVRLNVRPQKRKDLLHWVGHYARYWVAYPAGSNSAALGLDHFPPGDRQQQFEEREKRRLEFRRLMRARGFPHTLDGLKAMLTGPLDDELRDHLRAEKVLSDAWHYWNGDRSLLKDSHCPSDAIPIP